MKFERDFTCKNSLLNLWKKIESSIVYKLLFVLLMGLGGAGTGLVMGLLLGLELKYLFILMSFVFCCTVILSPFQYNIYKKKYRECIEREKYITKKDTPNFINNLNK